MAATVGTSAGVPQARARVDRWCVVALAVAAVLQVAETIPAINRTPRYFRVIPYLWVPSVLFAVVLVGAGVLLARPSTRTGAAAFLVGFSALTLLDVTRGIGELASSAARPANTAFWLWFLSSAIEAVVAIRALRIVTTGPRSRVRMPKAHTLAVGIVVFIAVGVGYGALVSAGPFVLLGIAALPALALRWADVARPLLSGLAASVALMWVSRVQIELLVAHSAQYLALFSLLMLPAVPMTVNFAWSVDAALVAPRRRPAP